MGEIWPKTCEEAGITWYRSTVGILFLAMIAAAWSLSERWISSIGALQRSGEVIAKSSFVFLRAGADRSEATIFSRKGAYSAGGPD